MKKQLEAMKNKQKEDVVDQLMSDFRNAKLAEIREGLPLPSALPRLSIAL